MRRNNGRRNNCSLGCMLRTKATGAASGALGGFVAGVFTAVMNVAINGGDAEHPNDDNQLEGVAALIIFGWTVGSAAVGTGAAIIRNRFFNENQREKQRQEQRQQQALLPEQQLSQAV